MHTQHRPLTVAAALALTAGLLMGAPPAQARVADPTTRHHSAPPLPRNGPIVYGSGYVAFDPDRSNDSEVFSVQPDGSGLTQLTDVPDGSQAGGPDVSPDGARIAYSSSESGGFGIWVMNADGSDQHAVLETPDVDYLQPRWSPDGRRLAVSACHVIRPFFILNCDLVVLRADGTRVRTIVGGHRNNRAPVWSPDGRWIAFDSDRAGFISAVWVVRATGGRSTRLTDPDLEAAWPSWSPNGSRIVFSSNWGRAHGEVYSVRADGSGVRQLTRTPEEGGGAWHASYSADGKRIVLITDRLNPGSDLYELHVMRRDGSGLTRVLADQPAFAPDWGPEGGAR